jgi:hypothetical protein
MFPKTLDVKEHFSSTGDVMRFVAFGRKPVGKGRRQVRVDQEFHG